MIIVRRPSHKLGFIW